MTPTKMGPYVMAAGEVMAVGWWADVGGARKRRRVGSGGWWEEERGGRGRRAGSPNLIRTRGPSTSSDRSIEEGTSKTEKQTAGKLRRRRRNACLFGTYHFPGNIPRSNIATVDGQMRRDDLLGGAASRVACAFGSQAIASIEAADLPQNA